MKAILSLCLGLIFCGCSTTQENKNLKVDSKSGYKDLSFQSSSQPLTQKGNFVLAKTNSCKTISEFECVQGPYMSLGSIKFDKLILTYTQDSLSQVVLFKGYDEDKWLMLAKSMREEYGEPTEIDQKKLGGSLLTVLKWSGNKTYVSLEGIATGAIILSMNTVSGLNRKFDLEESCRQQEQQKVKADL